MPRFAIENAYRARSKTIHVRASAILRLIRSHIAAFQIAHRNVLHLFEHFGRKHARIQQAILSQHHRSRHIRPSLVIIDRSTFIRRKHKRLAVHSERRNSIRLTQASQRIILDFNFFVFLDVQIKSRLGMVHITKREHIQYFFRFDIKLHKSIVLLQAHPRGFRILGNRNIFRFKRLNKTLHARFTNALCHQSKRILFAKSDNRLLRLFPSFRQISSTRHIHASNRQNTNAAFRVFHKIFIRRAFACHEQILSIRSKGNHVRHVTQFVFSKNFKFLVVAHHLHMSHFPFGVVQKTYRHEVAIDRHARGAPRQLDFAHLFWLGGVCHIDHFQNILAANHEQHFLFGHVRRNFSRRHRNGSNLLQCRTQMERSSRHIRFFSKRKARAHKQAHDKSGSFHFNSPRQCRD